MDPIEVSLTDFVDFVVSSGAPKQTKVKQIKEREDYQPAFDFWKPLREGIVDFHRNGRTDKRELDNILTGISDSKKLRRYPAYIRAYKRFLGRKSLRWFNPPWNTWGPDRIRIRVNPELGLVIKGEPHAIKLYFKSEKLSKQRTQLIVQLMETALTPCVNGPMRFGILDVANGKLYVNVPTTNTPLLPLLIGEATSFLTIWDSLD